ncbi:MAG: ABC transporter permease [Hoeflea sp.]|uniref:ABC transporter permease n=1 Tax=Hoeflea sp. TaxID=1940281 RepID=UPI000C0FF7B2|nr:ABC transporter permease [Hoeflea sp.]PHR25452.1 MAG: ABC transporter permease [Hoeflea sp.]
MTGDTVSLSNTTGQWLRKASRTLISLPFAYTAMVILLIVAYFMRPSLLTPMLLLLIARQAAPLGIAVLGQSLCMRVLSLDLSAGGVVVGVSYILTSGLLPYPEPVLMLIAVAFGIAVGLLNAFFITRLRASSVIVTLAVTMVITGVAVAFSQLRSPGDAPEILTELVRFKIGIVPVVLVIWAALLIAVAVFIRKSVFGRYVDAIGANPRAAWVSGIPYVRVVTIVHVMSSLFAVFAGFLLIGFVGVGSMDLGRDLALNSLAAVILGGVTFGSGKGGVLGPTVAALMLTFTFNLLTSLGLGEPAKLMLQGIIIGAAAAAYSVQRKN